LSGTFRIAAIGVGAACFGVAFGAGFAAGDGFEAIGAGFEVEGAGFVDVEGVRRGISPGGVGTITVGGFTRWRACSARACAIPVSMERFSEITC
jgi:hypothetical protein